MTQGIHRAHGAAAVGEYDPEKRAEKDSEQSSAWAYLLADAVVHRLPVPGLDAPLAAGEAQSSEAAQTPVAAAESQGSAESQARASSERTGAAGGEGNAALERIATEVDVSGLGKLALSVTREAGGLSIVISVADSHVKALIEAERAALVQALKTSGLSVTRVEIWGNQAAGTALAPNSRGIRSMSPRSQNSKVRAYRTSLDEEPADTAQNVDVTA